MAGGIGLLRARACASPDAGLIGLLGLSGNPDGGACQRIALPESLAWLTETRDAVIQGAGEDRIVLLVTAIGTPPVEWMSGCVISQVKKPEGGPPAPIFICDTPWKLGKQVAPNVFDASFPPR